MGSLPVTRQHDYSDTLYMRAFINMLHSHEPPHSTAHLHCRVGTTVELDLLPLSPSTSRESMDKSRSVGTNYKSSLWARTDRCCSPMALFRVLPPVTSGRVGPVLGISLSRVRGSGPCKRPLSFRSNHRRSCTSRLLASELVPKET